MHLFLDTSALVKLYHNEKGSHALRDFLKVQKEELVLSISDISMIEFLSSFMRRVRLHEIPLTKVRNVFLQFRTDALSFNIIETDTVIKDFSIRLIELHGSEKSLRTLDSLHIAAAIIFNQIIPVNYFLSVDRKQLAVAGDYFHTFNPEIEE